MSDTLEPKKKISPTLSVAELDQNVKSTKAALDRQPRVMIRLRKLADPKALNYETVSINGYLYKIMRGEDIEVPQSVRDILVEAGII